jgi:hypothetical protein
MSYPPSEHPILGEVVSVYTRFQALADGVLIDAGSMARESGFRWPAPIRVGAWADYVAWDDADSERQTHQDPSGRLWDVLFLAASAARAHTDAGSELTFQLYRVPRDGSSTQAKLTTLKLVVGPGDGGEAVMTILPNED